MKNYLKLFLTVLVAVLTIGFAHAQNTVKVTGVVTSAEDGLPMIGVGVMAGPGTGVITSLDGEYEITVAPGTELVFSSIGYNEEKVVVPQAEAFIKSPHKSLNTSAAIIISPHSLDFSRDNNYFCIS